MTKIESTPRTLRDWEEDLMPREIEALRDWYHTDPNELLTPSEVLECIVSWEGRNCVRIPHQEYYWQGIRHRALSTKPRGHRGFTFHGIMTTLQQRLLRRYGEMGKRIAAVQDWMNNYPRKVLQWQTPNEAAA